MAVFSISRLQYFYSVLVSDNTWSGVTKLERQDTKAKILFTGLVLHWTVLLLFHPLFICLGVWHDLWDAQPGRVVFRGLD